MIQKDPEKVGVLQKYKIENKIYLFSESAVEVLIKTNAWKDELKLKQYAEEIYDLTTGSILKHRYANYRIQQIRIVDALKILYYGLDDTDDLLRLAENAFSGCASTQRDNQFELKEFLEMRMSQTSLTDPLPLAISMLEECDRWACEALTKYIHKISLFETGLNIDDVYVHQQKIRIVIKKLRGEE